MICHLPYLWQNHEMMIATDPNVMIIRISYVPKLSDTWIKRTISVTKYTVLYVYLVSQKMIYSREIIFEKGLDTINWRHFNILEIAYKVPLLLFIRIFRFCVTGRWVHPEPNGHFCRGIPALIRRTVWNHRHHLHLR